MFENRPLSADDLQSSIIPVGDKGHIEIRPLTTDELSPRQQLTIAGREVTSDDDAVIELFIPLEEQLTAYPVTAGFPLANDTLYMPCGEDAVIDYP